MLLEGGKLNQEEEVVVEILALLEEEDPQDPQEELALHQSPLHK